MTARVAVGDHACHIDWAGLFTQLGLGLDLRVPLPPEPDPEPEG